MFRKDRKSFTIYFVSNFKSKVHSLSFSFWTAILLLTLSLSIISSFVYFAVTYPELKAASQEAAYLKNAVSQQEIEIKNKDAKITEVENLKKETEEIKILKQELEKKLQEIEELKSQIKQQLNVSPTSLNSRGSDPAVKSSSLKLASLNVEDVKEAKEELKELNTKAENEIKELKKLQKDIQARLYYLAHYPSLWPTRGTISSYFGERTSPFNEGSEFHHGLDIANNVGTNILAAADGTVTFAGLKGINGYLVTIEHGNGIHTNYAHLSKILVKRGQKVKKGEIIAKMGNTGRSTGPHLHFEVVKNGNPVNPLNYLQERSM